MAVAVLDSDASNGWYHVSYDGKVGYISSDYLAIDQDNVFTALRQGELRRCQRSFLRFYQRFPFWQLWTPAPS